MSSRAEIKNKKGKSAEDQSKALKTSKIKSALMSSVQEKMRGKVKDKAYKQIYELIDIMDQMNDKMKAYDMDQKEKLQFLSQETIVNCSNSLQNEESFHIDEKLKAKIFTRLIREYRRSLEYR